MLTRDLLLAELARRLKPEEDPRADDLLRAVEVMTMGHAVVREARQGDVVVVRMPKMASQEDAERVVRTVMRVFPKASVMTLAHGMEMELYRAQDADATDRGAMPINPPEGPDRF